MIEWLKGYIDQLNEIWGNLSTRARVIVSIGGLAVVLILGFMIFSSGDSQYQPLFSQLDPRDADAIVKELEDQGLSYRLTDNGRTILVPSDIVHKTRLDMAGAGLPSQGVVGFEIFDQSQFGTTDFERRVNYYRALGGELSRSIQALDAVEFAKVQITAPKESLFVDEEVPAEASVLLKIAAGYRLNAGQVRAITNLVASAVQGLEASRVTIVDTAGNLLTDQVSDGLNSQLTTMNQFDIERQFAKGLETDLRTMLSRVLGPDNFTVQVKVKLNFDQREVESKEYTPVVGDDGVIRSQEEHQESYQGEDATAQGVPGTSSNLPQYQVDEGENGSGSYETSSTITNYEINEKIERHVYAPGEVESLSVAVVLNDTGQAVDNDTISEVVQAAIGYDAARGDLISVTTLAFDQSLEEEIAQAEAAAAAAASRNMIIYAGLIALIAIILLIIFLVLRRSTGPVEEEIIPGTAMDYMVDEDVGMETAATKLSKEEKHRIAMKEEITDIITKKPEDVAQLLKSWLQND